MVFDKDDVFVWNLVLLGYVNVVCVKLNHGVGGNKFLVVNLSLIKISWA